MSEQTAREVIEQTLTYWLDRNDALRRQYTAEDVGRSLSWDVVGYLDKAGFAIVRKPTGDDRVMAVARAIGLEPTKEAYDAMAAALAAAAAADGRTPDDEQLVEVVVDAILDHTTQQIEETLMSIPPDGVLLGRAVEQIQRLTAERDRYRAAWQSARRRAAFDWLTSLIRHWHGKYEEKRATLDRVTDLFEKWAAEENEHRVAAEYGLAEGLHVAIDDLREAVHGEPTDPGCPHCGDLSDPDQPNLHARCRQIPEAEARRDGRE